MATDRTSSYLTHLPALFHEDAFVGRFLLAFERMLSGFGELVPSSELVKQLEDIRTQFVNIKRQFAATHTQLTTISPQISVIPAQVAELRPEVAQPLRRQLTTLDQQLTALKRQVDAVPLQLTTLRTRLEQPLREQLAEVSQQLDGLQERVGRVLENETRLHDQLEELRKKLAPVPSQLEEYRKQLRDMLSQAAALPAQTSYNRDLQLDQLLRQLPAIRTQLQASVGAQLQATRTELDTLQVQTKLTDFGAQLQAICTALVTSSSQTSDLAPQLGDLERPISEVENIRTELEQTIREGLARVAGELSDLGMYSGHQQLRDVRRTLSSLLEGVRALLVSVLEQLLALPIRTAAERVEQEQAIQTQLRWCREQLAQHVPSLEGIEDELTRMGIQPPTRSSKCGLQLQDFVERFALLMPSFLQTTEFGAQLNAVRVSVEQLGLQLNELGGQLAQPQAGQLTAIPDFFLAAIGGLLEDLCARLETLRSQMVTTHAQIAEFSSQPQLLALGQQLEAVGRQLETLRQQLTALPQHPDTFGTQEHEIHARLTEQAATLEELRGHIVHLSEEPDLTNLGPQVTRLHTRLAEILRSLATLTPQPAEINTQLVDSHTEISELGKRPALAGLKQRLEEAHSQLTESLAHVNSLSAQLEERRRQLEQPLRVRLDDVRRQLLDISRQLEAACTKLAVTASQLRLTEFSEQLNRFAITLAGFSTKPLTTPGEQLSVAAFNEHLIELDSQINQICIHLEMSCARIATIGVQPGLEDIIDRIHTYFIPGPLPATGRAPADFLPWLASWVALSIREDWEEEAKRRFISRIVSLYKHRGTKYGLEQILETYTGEDAVIYEFDHLPHYFQVEITLSEPTAAGVRRKGQIARAIIDQEKPAHTFYALRILVPTMRIMNDNLEHGIRVGHTTLLGTTVGKGSA